MRLGSLVSAIAGLVLGASVLPAGAQDAALDFTIQPARGSQTAADGNYFVIKAEPGSEVRQTIVVRNASSRRLELSIAPVDSYTNEAGAVDYEDPSMDADAVGDWIRVSSTVIGIGGGESVRVPFTVSIPEGARAGVNLGALSIQSTEDDGSGRAVVAVQVNTPGELVPEIVVSGVTGRTSSQGAFLDVEIANIGTRFASGQGTLTLRDQGLEFPIELSAFVPGTSTVYGVMWEGDVPEGEMPAEVEISYGDGFAAEWAGTVSFTRADPISTPAEESDGGSGGVVVIVLAALVALAGAFYLGTWKARAATIPSVEGKPWRSFTPKENPVGSGETSPAPADAPGPTTAIAERAPVPSPEVAARGRDEAEEIDGPAEPLPTEAAAEPHSSEETAGTEEVEAPAEGETAEDAEPEPSVAGVGEDVEVASSAPVEAPNSSDDGAPREASHGKERQPKPRKKTSRKKTTRKKTTGKKAAAKKTTRKKTTGKKAAAKKTSRKATGKKTSGKDTSGKQPVAKRSSAEKTDADKDNGHATGSSAREDPAPSGDHPAAATVADDESEERSER